MRHLTEGQKVAAQERVRVAAAEAARTAVAEAKARGLVGEDVSLVKVAAERRAVVTETARQGLPMKPKSRLAAADAEQAAQAAWARALDPRDAALEPPSVAVQPIPMIRKGCLHPDKEAWHTKEGVDAVIAMMRAQGRHEAQWLNAYECRCGYWHAGRRTKRAFDEVIARYGT